MIFLLRNISLSKMMHTENEESTESSSVVFLVSRRGVSNRKNHRDRNVDPPRSHDSLDRYSTTYARSFRRRLIVDDGSRSRTFLRKRRKVPSIILSPPPLPPTRLLKFSRR